jgi:hypothetical protein
MRSVLLLLLVSSAAAAAAEPSQVLFDDFSYASIDAFRAHGWIDRTTQGWPGVPGATWQGTVGFVDDPANKDNRLVRMTAATDGAKTSRHSSVTSANIAKALMRRACASATVRSKGPTATRSSKRSTRSRR